MRTKTLLFSIVWLGGAMVAPTGSPLRKPPRIPIDRPSRTRTNSSSRRRPRRPSSTRAISPAPFACGCSSARAPIASTITSDSTSTVRTRTTAHSHQVYTGGGLIDIRTIEATGRQRERPSLRRYRAVLEAMTVGIGADIWGDIPYSEAVTNTKTPKLDPQQHVYAGIQAKLDTAITMLTAGTGAGPGGADLFYGGDATKWLRLAHTLQGAVLPARRRAPGHAGVPERARRGAARAADGRRHGLVPVGRP